MVGPDDVAKAVGEYKVALADREITQVEIQEVDLRIQQLQRKHARSFVVARLAERLKKEMLPSAPGQPGAGSAGPSPARP
jgi:hypothetical protein